MIMDRNCREYSSVPTSGIELNNNHYNKLQDSSLVNTHDHNFDFNDVVLKYIDHILMEEEDVEEKACTFLESADLQAAEKSFHDVIEDHNSNLNQEIQNPRDISSRDSNDYNGDTEKTSPDRNETHSSVNSDGPINSPLCALKILDMFKRGFEGGSKFLPNDESFDVFRGKKIVHHDNICLEDDTSRKKSALYTEPTLSPDVFDEVLLLRSGGKPNKVTKSTPPNSQTAKIRVKKHVEKKNVVDMRTLLTLCAQSIASGDAHAANNYLKQIRQHSSPTGDGTQRLAHYFADGLEARLAGSGSQIYASLKIPISASVILKAYHIYLDKCPFRNISDFFSNKTIMNVAEKVTRLHIVDFGILYGFQWPSFLHGLSLLPGGPPSVRITGIDLPCSGFRPAERVEETGRRLARYAEIFEIPFQFHGIAQKWETIKLEDLNIDRDEVLVVNCLYTFRNLLDETVMVSSPRNTVLNLIKKMNPSCFVLGILNGSYNAPLFITRFREALFHYSSFFDVLDANIPREIHERVLLERIILGREAMNVIACEGVERVERPETYKQWQVRNKRAGFEQLPLDREITESFKNRVKSSYHKEFVIEEDGQWMLQGWKGRILYALSSWTPNKD